MLCGAPQTPTGERLPPLAIFPKPGDVVTEIGRLLTIHFAVAFAIALALRLFGIA